MRNRLNALGSREFGRRLTSSRGVRLDVEVNGRLHTVVLRLDLGDRNTAKYVPPYATVSSLGAKVTTGEGTPAALPHEMGTAQSGSYANSRSVKANVYYLQGFGPAVAPLWVHPNLAISAGSSRSRGQSTGLNVPSARTLLFGGESACFELPTSAFRVSVERPGAGKVAGSDVTGSALMGFPKEVAVEAGTVGDQNPPSAVTPPAVHGHQLAAIDGHAPVGLLDGEVATPRQKEELNDALGRVLPIVDGLDLSAVEDTVTRHIDQRLAAEPHVGSVAPDPARRGPPGGPVVTIRPWT